MWSCIYTGQITHRRFLPKPHAFAYDVFMMYVDLEQLPSLFNKNKFWSYLKPNLAYFNRSDYYGNPAQPLKSEILRLVEQNLGRPTLGKVCLLTNLRYFGHCFNPVSFYYCYAADHTTLEAIVTHITNTPWGEDFAYVHDCTHDNHGLIDANSYQFSLAKAFHVSPFMPMDIEYDWRFSAPSERLNVFMQNHQSGVKMFDATLVLKYKPITPRNLNKLLLKYPFMTVKVVIAIYWQALRLWLKRIPFYSHPQSRT